MTEAISKKDLIAYRGFHPSDYNFIISTWLPGLYHGNEWFNLIDREVYFENYHKVIEGLLAKPTTQFYIACLADTSDVILGYSVFTNKTLHYVFVKKVWREIGIAASLIPEGLEDITHITTQGLSILKKKFPKVKFNPFHI